MHGVLAPHPRVDVAPRDPSLAPPQGLCQALKVPPRAGDAAATGTEVSLGVCMQQDSADPGLATGFRARSCKNPKPEIPGQLHPSCASPRSARRRRFSAPRPLRLRARWDPARSCWVWLQIPGTGGERRLCPSTFFVWGAPGGRAVTYAGVEVPKGQRCSAGPPPPAAACPMGAVRGGWGPADFILPRGNRIKSLLLKWVICCPSPCSAPGGPAACVWGGGVGITGVGTGRASAPR